MCLVTFAAKAQVNPKPFVIPELQQWKGAKGETALTPKTRIIVNMRQGSTSAETDAVNRVARQFADELGTMLKFTPECASGKAAAGDIVLSIGKVKSDNPEAYAINIGKVTKVTGNKPVGVFWATRTLLQIIQGSGKASLPCGKVLDWPAFKMRGFMLDCGRKYFPIDFLRKYVSFLAYYKMNTFQIHLNDNGFVPFYEMDWQKTYSAFRLESDRFPGLTAKDGHYTKAEFKDLQKLAEDNFVNIIPEIDAPAHSLAFTQYRPSIAGGKYGMDHLNLFKQETYNFLDSLYDEYLSGPDPVFRGKYVHIGTDEYSNADKEVVEKFRYFTDHYIRFVEKYGKRAALWGSLDHAKGETKVSSDSVLMWCWYNGYADPKKMMAEGFDVMSIPDSWVYIVPAVGYYYDYFDTRRVYDKWTPSQIGDEKFEYPNEKIKGGMFALWNDHQHNGITWFDIHHRVFPAVQTMAVKLWKGASVTMKFDEFDHLRGRLSEGPGVDWIGNYGGRRGELLHIDTVRSKQHISNGNSGYDYEVSFNVKAKDNFNGCILFMSPTTKFYLREPMTGKLGFSSNGYSYSFNYEVPQDSMVSIAVRGDSVSTTLYVNGKLADRLERHWVYFEQNHKTKRADVPTLNFPLQDAGGFNGIITDLRFRKY